MSECNKEYLDFCGICDNFDRLTGYCKLASEVKINSDSFQSKVVEYLYCANARIKNFPVILDNDEIRTFQGRIFHRDDLDVNKFSKDLLNKE